MVNEAGKGYYGSKGTTEFGDAGGDNARSKSIAALVRVVKAPCTCAT